MPSVFCISRRKNNVNYTITREACMWERLKSTAAPLVLYGTGNGADKLIDALAAIGRMPDGVFASDGFVRRRTFRDMPVLSYAEARENFSDAMNVLIAFGSSLPDVMGKMDELAEKHVTYIPELPLFGGDLFTYDYYLAHREEIAAAYAMLSDDESRILFTDMLDYRLRGEVRCLRRTQPDADSYKELLGNMPVHRALDGGAYNGDSARTMLKAFPMLAKIRACEPDPRTVRKLTAWAEETGGIIEVIPCALSDNAGSMDFHTSGSRGSGGNGANRRGADTQVQTETIDRLCADFHPDLIKLDVEGWEAEALRGAEETLLRDRPALAVSLYHRAQDLFALPLWLRDHTRGSYSWHLRRVPCYPAWDLMLYAVPNG